MASREERRLLILAPVGKDAALIESLLGKDAVLCARCRDLDHLACEIETGVGAILIAEEAIAHHEGRLAAIMRQQPPWSDIPLLVLTTRRRVTVTDTGIGIRSDALSRVFDLFTQADDRDRHSQTGLGIGLTLARSLVEMHGGSISAESEGAGRGSRFVVRLPLSTAKTTSGTRPTSSAPAMKASQRVLVVDDNGDAADTLGALLEILGAEVQVAYDGSAALRAMDAFQPRVVVLDLGMPGMDGYEVARRIRELPASRQPTLIALTGWGQEKDRQLTEAAGFDHHLIKPVDIRALQAVLASLG